MARQAIGISRQTVSEVTFKGLIMAAMPRIRKILAILLPRTLPIARSVVPRPEAMILTTSSGMEVPKATTVRPMVKSEIRMRRAKAADPSTRRSAPLISSTKPAMIIPRVSIA